MQNNLRFVEVDDQTFWKEVTRHFRRIYFNRLDMDPSRHLDESEKTKLTNLAVNKTRLFNLKVLIRRGEELVGWHIGEQEDGDSYYMRNSAILENFRGQNYYENLLNFLVKRLTTQGFQVLTSKHHPNNPAILIPKLRQGFIITSTEMNDRFGFLVTLKYFVNETRRKDFGKRIGLEL